MYFHCVCVHGPFCVCAFFCLCVALTGHRIGQETGGEGYIEGFQGTVHKADESDMPPSDLSLLVFG